MHMKLRTYKEVRKNGKASEAKKKFLQFQAGIFLVVLDFVKGPHRHRNGVGLFVLALPALKVHEHLQTMRNQVETRT